MALSTDEVEAIYRSYGHLVLGRCRVVLRNPALADDALQEVFVRLMRYGDAYRDAEAPIRWLFRVSDRVCFDLVRKQGKQPLSTGDEETQAVTAVHPGQNLEERDMAMRLLNKMDQRSCQIAVLYFVDGLSQGEVAEELGLSRVTINKSLKKLRERGQIFRRMMERG